MGSCELVNLISMLTCLIVENYNDDEIALLAAIFTQLGDSLATILANNAVIDSKKNIDNKNQINAILWHA